MIVTYLTLTNQLSKLYCTYSFTNNDILIRIEDKEGCGMNVKYWENPNKQSSFINLGVIQNDLYKLFISNLCLKLFLI